jgi:redox-sensitive bicupin YhaK (pirin superfamily)
MSIRPVKRVIKSKPTLEGAGVHLRRAFGFGNTGDFDPVPAAGRFPQRRSRRLSVGLPLASAPRIETITYVLAGTVEHGDSMGNRGAIARATSSG